MVDGLPANVGIGIVLSIRSSPLATGVPVQTCTGTCSTWCRRVKKSFEEVSVTRIPVVQTNSMNQVASVFRGLALNEDLE